MKSGVWEDGPAMSTTEQQPPAEPTGRPGKYQRTTAGLVAALVVTAVAIVVAIWVMGLFRDETEVKPEAIDLPGTITDAQDAGLQPVYPTSLPDGWIATGAEVPSDGDGFEIRMLTGDEHFIGIREAKRSSAVELLHTYVDEDPSEADDYTSDGQVAKDWAGFEDAGGDSAYAAELPHHEVVLVYGSAPAEDLQQVVDSLTTAPAR
jgi:hypothetical protein